MTHDHKNLFAMNVVNSEVLRKNAFSTEEPDVETKEINNQILLNQQVIMVLLLEQSGYNTDHLLEKINQIKYDKDYDKWTT